MIPEVKLNISLQERSLRGEAREISKVGTGIRITTYSLACIFFMACSGRRHHNISKVRVEHYYDWMDRGEIDSVFTLFAPNFFSLSDSLSLRQVLVRIKSRGSVVSRRNYKSGREMKYEDGERKLYISLKYSVEYSNGMLSDEQFLFLSDNKHSDVLFRFDVRELVPE